MTLTKEERNRVTENHNLIYAYCRMKNLSVNEWYGVLAEALCKCAMYYDESRGVAFSTFAYRVFGFAVYEMNRTEKHLKRSIPPQNIVSLYEKMPVGEENMEVIGFLEDKFSVEDYCVNKVFCAKIFDFIETEFSERDIKMIKLWLQEGYSQEKIGNMLGISQSLVSRRITNMRKRIKIQFGT